MQTLFKNINSMAPRKWENAEGDQAYLSHHHTLEVIGDLSYEYGIFESVTLHSLGNEYRNSFSTLQFFSSFSVTTIVFQDTSTYTYIHKSTAYPIAKADNIEKIRLSSCDIRRPENRLKRAKEVKSALKSLGVIPQDKDVQEPEKTEGIETRREADGSYVLDYSGFRSGKMESEARVLDYSKFKAPHEKPD